MKELGNLVLENWAVIPLAVGMGVAVFGVGEAGYGAWRGYLNDPNALSTVMKGTFMTACGSAGTIFSYKLYEFLS